MTDLPTETVQPQPRTESICPSEQIVLILVGLIGSGKSTFAQALERHAPQFRRCSQDELGNRRRVEDHARAYLREGLSVCIDRTNIDASQRETWIRIAREFPSVLIWVIVFDVPYEICKERLYGRTGHPTIRDAAHGISVLERFHSQFQKPRPAEGYDQILFLRAPDDTPPSYSREQILEILGRLKRSPRIDRTTADAPWRSLPDRDRPQREASFGQQHSSRGWRRGSRGDSYGDRNGGYHSNSSLLPTTSAPQ